MRKTLFKLHFVIVCTSLKKCLQFCRFLESSLLKSLFFEYIYMGFLDFVYTDATLCSSDHISWHTPLDSDNENTNIRQMLLSEDPQLHQLNTPFGYVNFIQVKFLFIIYNPLCCSE